MEVMIRITKFILLALTIVSFALPAIAWEFSASGSSSATYKRTTYNSGTGTNDNLTNEYTSSAGGVTASMSHTDGYANSVTISYTADWNSDDSNFDEYVKVSGTKKVGKWTASSSTTQHIQKDVTGSTDHAPMTSDATASFSLTDGSITYRFGDANHLSTAEKTSDGPMDGTIDAEARVDSFDGFSLGFAIGAGTLTFAIDENDDQDIFGDRDLIVPCGSDNMGFGLSFLGDLGVDLALTFAMGSATAQADCSNTSDTASATILGIGIGIPLGGMELAFDIEKTAWNSTIASIETKEEINGIEVSFTIPFGDATAGINLSQQENNTTNDGKNTAKTSTAGTEAWYTIPIGPVGLSIGYGLSGVTVGCSTCSLTNELTSTTSQLGAEITMSF